MVLASASDYLDYAEVAIGGCSEQQQQQILLQIEMQNRYPWQPMLPSWLVAWPVETPWFENLPFVLVETRVLSAVAEMIGVRLEAHSRYVHSMSMLASALALKPVAFHFQQDLKEHANVQQTPEDDAGADAEFAHCHGV